MTYQEGLQKCYIYGYYITIVQHTVLLYAVKDLERLFA